jgi:hypothetical protein
MDWLRAVLTAAEFIRGVILLSKATYYLLPTELKAER